MHLRRTTSERLTISDAINTIGNGAPSISNSSQRRQFKKNDLWTASLCLLVFLVLQIELLAYKVLISDRDDDNSHVHGVQSVLRGGNDGLMAESSDNQPPKDQPKEHPKPQLNLQHHKQKAQHKAAIPNKQPTPVKQPTLDESSSSYEPTKPLKRWRIKEAREKSNANARFWNEYEPDKVIPPSNSTDLPPVIAYVTTLTKCSEHRGSLDGAAVLMHSIRRNSHGWIPMQLQSSSSSVDFDPSLWPKYGGKGGRYRYRAYVIVDPMASPTIKSRSGDCARFLQSIGWTVLHRPPLVPLFEITPKDNSAPVQPSATFAELERAGYVGVQRPKTGETARKPLEHRNKLPMLMHNDGCCGYTELLKLGVYGLVQHDLAVHLDFDSLILRPMDDLFDVMLGKQKDDEVADSVSIAKLPLSKPVDFSRPIDAAFTRDYNSVKHPKPDSSVGYQGGFLVVRPSLTVLERYRKILQRGEFTLNPRKGWGNKHDNFYGDVTFQGILPYYYEDVAPPGEHNELELDRCTYNQMADNPYQSTHRFPRATPLDPEVMGYGDRKKCRDGRKDCSDTDCQRVSHSVY